MPEPALRERELDDAELVRGTNAATRVLIDGTGDYGGGQFTLFYNVIAQEFAEVFPDAVTESGDKLSSGEKILQVDTYPAAIHAVAAIQELHRAVKEKDERIAKLEDSNRTLEERLNRLERACWSPRQRGLAAN